MIRLLIVLAPALLVLILIPGCSTLAGYGIGGPPELLCDRQEKTAQIDDRIAGSDGVRLSVVRRFKAGDDLCK